MRVCVENVSIVRYDYLASGYALKVIHFCVSSKKMNSSLVIFVWNLHTYPFMIYLAKIKHSRESGKIDTYNAMYNCTVERNII